MKKALLTLSFFSFLVFAATAQDDDKLVKLGIRAGANYNTIVGKDFGGENVSNSYKVGYHAGITADLYVFPGFYLQPGLIYTTKGAMKEANNIKSTSNISYIELPVNVLLKLGMGNGKLLIGAGPYAAYGINGNLKSKAGSSTTTLDANFTNTISAADVLNGNLYNVRRWDYGVNALAGYEFASGFNFQLNAQLGLKKLNPEIESVTVDKTSIKHFGVGLSVGYKF